MSIKLLNENTLLTRSKILADERDLFGDVAMREYNHDMISFIDRYDNRLNGYLSYINYVFMKENVALSNKQSNNINIAILNIVKDIIDEVESNNT